jgi:hypothetical protein
MDSPLFNRWSAQSKVSDIRSKIDYSLRRATKPKSNFSVLSTPSLLKSPSFGSRPPNFSVRKEVSPISQASLSHYRSLHRFKSSTGLFNSRKSPSETQTLSKVPSSDSLMRFSDYFSEKPRSPTFSAGKNETYEGKMINEVISLATVTRAIQLVNNGGLEGISLAYTRQLKTFCSEVLNNFDE